MLASILSCLWDKNYHRKGLTDGKTAGEDEDSGRPITVTRELLNLQNADTSQAIIHNFHNNRKFVCVSRFETDMIVKRDQEDAEKLLKGIQYSIAKGVLSELVTPPQYQEINVLGKSPGEVCDVILQDIRHRSNGNKVIMVLCGLSGTGKGTTVAMLQEKLPSVVTWSNGNVFRALTLLAVTWCKLFNLPEFNADAALTKDNVAGFAKMLKFGPFGANGEWDIRVTGLGLDVLISEIKNTTLKSPEVAKHIPTVAERVQGEVVVFAGEATRILCENGMNVIIEGREATVNYVQTPFRYTLVLPDPQILGKRRAAQRIAANAQKLLNESSASTSEVSVDEDNAKIKKSIRRALNGIVEELKQDEEGAKFVAESLASNGDSGAAGDKKESANDDDESDDDDSGSSGDEEEDDDEL